jgi:hypothetical protein
MRARQKQILISLSVEPDLLYQWRPIPHRRQTSKCQFPLLTLLDAPEFTRLATGNPKSGPALPPGSGGSRGDARARLAPIRPLKPLRQKKASSFRRQFPWLLPRRGYLASLRFTRQGRGDLGSRLPSSAPSGSNTTRTSALRTFAPARPT